jgi:hypothetical protein
MPGISNRIIGIANFYNQLKILAVVSSPFVKRTPGFKKKNVSIYSHVTIFCHFYSAISCFFSVLRQFKIVKPTHQPGEKNKQALKIKLSECCMDVKCNKNLIHFFFLQKKSPTKCKIKR